LDSEPKTFYARFPIALARQKTAKASGVLNYQNHRLLIDPVNRGFIMRSGNRIHGDLSMLKKTVGGLGLSPALTSLRDVGLGQIEVPRKDQRRDLAMNQTIGKQLPDFELPDQDGQTAQLSELVGKFPFILTFYRGYW